jgi:hypothetical protein
MFLNVPSRKLQCSTVVFMKVSRSEPISLTCLQPEQSLIMLFYSRVAPLLVYFQNDLNIEKDMKYATTFC